MLCKSGTCCGLFYGAKCFNFLAVLGLLDVMLYRFLLTYFNCFCLQFSGQCCNESDTQSFHLLLAFTVVQNAKPTVFRAMHGDDWDVQWLAKEKKFKKRMWFQAFFVHQCIKMRMYTKPVKGNHMP